MLEQPSTIPSTSAVDAHPAAVHAKLSAYLAAKDGVTARLHAEALAHQNAAVEASRSAHAATASQTALTEQRAHTATQPANVKSDLAALHPRAHRHKPGGTTPPAARHRPQRLHPPSNQRAGTRGSGHRRTEPPNRTPAALAAERP